MKTKYEDIRQIVTSTAGRKANWYEPASDHRFRIKFVNQMAESNGSLALDITYQLQQAGYPVESRNLNAVEVHSCGYYTTVLIPNSYRCELV